MTSGIYAERSLESVRVVYDDEDVHITVFLSVEEAKDLIRELKAAVKEVEAVE